MSSVSDGSAPVVYTPEALVVALVTDRVFADEARLHLSRAGIRQSFTTRNRLSEGQIRMELVEGPFESFEGCWSFDSLRDDACKVSLRLAFRLSNALAGRAARQLFESVANGLVDAVCRRARELHGRRHGPPRGP